MELILERLAHFRQLTIPVYQSGQFQQVLPVTMPVYQSEISVGELPITMASP